MTYMYVQNSLNAVEAKTLGFMNLMLQSFVTTAPPPMGKGGDYDFTAFSALLYKPHPQGANWRSKLCSLQ